MSKTRVYVSAYRIGRHVQGEIADDPITVEDASGRVTHGRAFRIDGPSIIRYDPAAAHPSGARCLVETDAPVTPLNPERTADAAPFSAAEAARGIEELVEAGRAIAKQRKETP
jgi:hypothetical protein